jgi:hypothetical protein
MAMVHCRECGKNISDSATSCPHCGAKQKHSSSTKEKKVNWTLTLIMSIIFGGIGVDRFIMGHIGLGILKLITLGGCGIWWLVDLILIASKHKFEDIEWVTD